MNGDDKLHFPGALPEQVTLTQCVPLGPIAPDTQYRILGRTVFRDVRYFSYGATCMAYEALDPAGNRRIITEFCPVRFWPSLYRAPDQALRLREDDVRRERYLVERAEFIRKWQTQVRSQEKDRLYGNNGPELYFLGETPCLVMHYDGEPLRDFSGTEPEALLAGLLQAADAIDQVHQTGLLLNDIKPDNLLFTGGAGTVVFRRVLDYGSALPLKAMCEAYHACDVSYSRDFCSPELEGQKYWKLTFGSDVYSFGQTVLFLLCGFCLRNTHKTAKILASQEAFCRHICSSAPEDAPVRRLRAKDPDAFFTHLYTFVLHTLSPEVMPEEHVFDFRTEPYVSGELGPLRLRRMADARRMLERVLGAARPPEALDLHLAWSVSRERARRFEAAGFGNSQRAQWEMERKLFSEDILMRCRTPDGAVLSLAQLPELEGNIFLEGCSGAGKSVGMRWLYSRIAGQTGVSGDPAWLPVYLPMERAAASGLPLTAYVARELFGPREDRAAAEKTAACWLSGKSGVRVLVLCDGVNEISGAGGAMLSDTLEQLARSADPECLRLIVSGQNQLQELPHFPGRVLRACPPEWETVRDYLYSRLPVAADDRGIGERLEHLRQALSTPQQIHDLCVPHIGKNRLHPRAIPADAGRLLHDYLHSWCAKEKIHRAVCGVSAYSSGQESGEPYGELLLAQLARLCWTMTRTNAYRVGQSVLREQLRLVLLSSGEELPELGCAYLTEAELERILSLTWCGVLFELDGQEMHIRHEAYRDYLAAEFLAEIFNTYTENRFPAVLMQPIPGRVLRYLEPMLHSDTVHRLCGRLRAEKNARFWGAIGRQFLEQILDKRIRHRNMSVLHRDDLIQAGNTMARLVRAKGFSRRTTRRLLAGVIHDPRIWFRKEDWA